MQLVFMYEISQIITKTEKDCQTTDMFPPERKRRMELLRSRLQNAHNSFKDGKIPDSFDIIQSRGPGSVWKAWDLLKKRIDEISTKKEFYGVPLLIDNSQGRQTRSTSAESKLHSNYRHKIDLNKSTTHISTTTTPKSQNRH